MRVLPDFLQDVPDVEYLIDPIGEGLRVTASASQEIKGNDIDFELGNKRDHSQGFQLTTPIAMQVDDRVLGLDVRRSKQEGRNNLTISIANFQILAYNLDFPDKPLDRPQQMPLRFNLHRFHDIFPGILVHVHFLISFLSFQLMQCLFLQTPLLLLTFGFEFSWGVLMSIKDITLQLVLKFLKEKGYTESYLHLEIDAKTNLRDYPKEIQFFKKILLKGDFNQAVQFIWAFQQKIPSPTLKKLTLQIYKQKLYQLLENPSQSELRNLFQKQIINVCSEQEYQHLFTLLTCRSVKEIPGMDGWSPMKGRYGCFQEIQPYLEGFFNVAAYQKGVAKVPGFGLEEAVESFVAAQQRVQQRMEKSQNVTKPIGSIGIRSSTDKQSKQSIEMKPSKYENESKLLKAQQQKPLESSTLGRSYPQKPYLPVNPSPQSSLLKQPGPSLQPLPRRPLHEDIEMSQSKVEKPAMMSKYDKMGQSSDKEELAGSTFVKKYNQYVETSGVSGYGKGKDEGRGSAFMRNYRVQEIEEQEREKSGVGNKDSRYKEKQLQRSKKPYTNPSYLKQFQKQANDSEVFQEEVRRNIAYLDQNNSVVEKDEQNQNFTFSNGAEESGLHDKNRKIFKLASFSDPKAIRTCQFSPSGNLFAFGTNSSYLKIYDVQQLFETNEYKEILPICQIPQLHTKSIYCLDWSLNQKAMATCSNDLTIKITEFTDNFSFTNYKTNVIGRHESSVRMVKFNSLQNRLISCGDDSLLKVWDIGKIKKCTNLKGHTQSISAFKFGEGEQDGIIYSASKDCTVRKWDLRVGQCVAVSEMHDCELTFIADNIDRIVVSDKAGSVLFYNESLQLQQSLKIHEQQIRSIDGSSYEDLLLTASFDGHICIFSEKGYETPNYHQHNQKLDDKVVYATFLGHPEHHGFASTSTMGICNIYSFQ